MPHLRSLVERHADDPFVLLGVNTNDSREDFAKGVEEYGVTWPVLYQGPVAFVAQLYSVRAYPTYLLLDKDGKIVHRGGAPSDALIAKLIREAKDARGK